MSYAELDRRAGKSKRAKKPAVIRKAADAKSMCGPEVPHAQNKLRNDGMPTAQKCESI